MPEESKKKLNVEGCDILILVESNDTGGKWSLLDHTMPSQTSPPPKHFHNSFDQFLYVIEGEPSVHLGNEIISMKPGSSIHIPKGTTHTLENPSSKSARFLTFMIPGGFENFFIELNKLEREAKCSNNVPNPELVKELAAKFDEHYI